MNQKQRRINRLAWLLFAFSSLCGLTDIIHITLVLCFDEKPNPMYPAHYLPGQGLVGGFFGLISSIISLVVVRTGIYFFVYSGNPTAGTF